MMTQSVMTQAANLSRMAAGTSSPKTRQKGNSFGTFMDDNLKGMDSTDAKAKRLDTDGARGKDRTDDISKTKKNTDEEAVAVDKGNADKTKTEEGPDKTTAATCQLKASMENAKASDAAGAPAEEAVDGQDENSGGDEMLAQILGILQSIQEAVMRILKLSPEEFDQLLADQGLKLSELTDAEGLQRLVLEKYGSTDVMDFLTDGELGQTLNQLVQEVEDILKGAAPVRTEEELKAAAEELETKQMFTSDTKAQAGTAVREAAVLGAEQRPEKTEPGSDPGQTEAGAGGEPEVEVIRMAEGNGSDKQTAPDTGDKEAKEQERISRYEVFLDNLTKTSGDTIIGEQQDIGRITELREIADQIVERIRIVMKPEQTSMELVLNPEHLGRVSLTVLAKNGAMTAEFKVENELTKEAIESQLQTLKETLNTQGIKVEAIEVTIAGYTFGESSQPETEDQAFSRKKEQGQKISLAEALSMEEESAQEDMLTDFTGLRGTNIDATA